MRFAAEARHHSIEVGGHCSDDTSTLLIQCSILDKAGDAARKKRIAGCQTHTIDFRTNTLPRERPKIVKVPGALDFSSTHHKCTLKRQLSAARGFARVRWKLCWAFAQIDNDPLTRIVHSTWANRISKPPESLRTKSRNP